MPVIVGPTASGKTELALKIAESCNGEIISADSRQMVREMNIGTAKPTEAELGRVVHHFINNISPTDDIYNSYIFGNEARKSMCQIIDSGKKVVIAGGSGLYVQSLVHGFFDDLGISDEEKLIYRKTLEKKDLEECFKQLKIIDPEYADKIPATNKQRIYRALEVYRFSGKKISDLHREHIEKRFFNPIYIAIDHEREVLYDRINRRVINMFEMGLMDEVKELIEKYGSELKRLNKTIGYMEVVSHLEGKISYQEMVAQIQQNSRRFAKRQITWFKRLDNIRWFKPGDDGEILNYVNNALKMS